MNKQITYLLSCLMVLFVLSSCVTTGNGSEKKEKPHDETHSGGDDNDGKEEADPSGTYKIVKRGTKISSDMSMKIISVQDSRCPTNTNCFVAGEAKIVFEITKDGRSVEATLKAKGNCEGDDGKCGNSTVAAGQKIQLLNLYPYPEANSKIDQGDYTAKVKIN